MKPILSKSLLLIFVIVCIGCSDNGGSPTSLTTNLERNIVNTQWFYIVRQAISSMAYAVKFEQNHTVKFYVEATMSDRDGDYLGGGTWSVQGDRISFNYTPLDSGLTEQYTGTVNAQGTCMQGTVTLGNGVVVNWWNTMVRDCGR